jgi:hypothetical protein
VITYVAVAVGYSRTGTRVQHISESNKDNAYHEWVCGPGDDHDDDGQHGKVVWGGFRDSAIRLNFEG